MTKSPMRFATALRLPPHGDVREFNVPSICSVADALLGLARGQLFLFPIPTFLLPAMSRIIRKMPIQEMSSWMGAGTVMPSFLHVPVPAVSAAITLTDPIVSWESPRNDKWESRLLIKAEPGGKLENGSIGFLIRNTSNLAEMSDNDLRECHMVEEGEDFRQQLTDRSVSWLLRKLAAEVDELLEERRKKSLAALPDLYLPEGMKEEIVQDLEHFLSAHDLYRSMGMAWRRGYLFYGPPGNGKTKLIRLLGQHFDLHISDICTRISQDGRLLLSSGMPRHLDWDDLSTDMSGVLDESKGMSMRNLDAQPITSRLVSLPDEDWPLVAKIMKLRTPDAYYIEDLDKFVHFQSSGKHRDGSKISLHDLLKGLDGVEGADGAIVFMTTNYPEELAESLVRRPGRIDRIWELPIPRPEQIEALLRGMRYSCEDKPVEKVAAELADMGASMAFAEELMKSLYMRHRRKEFGREEVEKEIEHIRQHLDLTNEEGRRRWNKKPTKKAGFATEEE